MSFGISNNVRSREVRECTPELFWKAVRSPLVADICAQIADGLEKVKRGEMVKEDYETLKAGLKKRLPIFTPHATFRNGRRLNADAVPSGLSMYDIDHLPNPREYWVEKSQELAVKDVLRFVVLAHITPSTEGLRLFFIIPDGMDLAGAQKWMSEQLGDANYDQSVKDLARSSFVVPEDYIIYVDEERLFKNEELKMKNEESPCHAGLSDDNRRGVSHTPECVNENASGDAHVDDKADVSGRMQYAPTEMAFKGVPYSDIIRHWFALTGGEPVQGERNDKLHRLASHLRYITDNNEEILLQIMPRYGLSEEEMKGLIHSACSAKWYSMPKLMKEACRGVSHTPECTNENANGDVCADVSGRMRYAPTVPPELPKKLPKLIGLLVSRTPDVYKPAVAHAVFPPLATHLHKVRFKYIDNVEHEATLMNVLMAGTGAGKDCISEPINRIMADIRRRDEENLRREREWKNEVNSKGSNKDKRQRPEGLVIQEIDADMTNPAFVMRTAEAEGHFLYTKLNEIDQFDALRGSGRGNQQFQIMCLAFDPGNRYGQTRVGTQSITEKVTIRFNWNAATTILKGKRYFSRVLTDGPISRINFCTIPEREIGADMPVYGTYDAAFDEELRPYIENLNRATGLVDCPQAFRLAEKMRKENAEFATLSQSRVYENLSFRANVIAYLKACVLYVANGEKWDKSIEEFVRWSFHYDMWCKMEFFGEAIEEAMNENVYGTSSKHGPQNLLTLLPDEFTLDDVIRARQMAGLDVKGTKQMLYQWVYRHYLTVLTDNSYKKLKFRSDGINLKPDRKR
ncbi:BT4734/BF3469 family protein [Bacteroides sp. An269]|uniref:BT4734/BF3469 family protein n=1 Tax=Bacteroides sp. An269 TaxID=1965613 RepID=UPI000B36A628|nr:BT4734/BF3469 family protein [Bacteroides sp. An269]OUO69532.1 VirE protein [Bacteroides sp. An269]